jgi:hypothetical protein
MGGSSNHYYNEYTYTEQYIKAEQFKLLFCSQPNIFFLRDYPYI